MDSNVVATPYRYNCFAYSYSGCDGCNILTEMNCQNCSFFKTHEQYEFDLNRASYIYRKRNKDSTFKSRYDSNEDI